MFLPVRLGVLGIPIFSEISELEFENFRSMSKYLADKKIAAQYSNHTVDSERDREISMVIKKERELRENAKLLEVRSCMSKEQLRANNIA